MTGSGFSRIQTSDQTKLTRGLRSRHVELIAIGGAIGVGLFLGSAKVIQNAGPGLILGYAVGGLVIFFIMRALGELLLYRPVAGSFVTYADEFVGPFAGFATGWSYWFTWVVTGMAELTAISLVPWNEIEPRMSPFVLVFDRMGIPGAADIVNLVVITAAMSSCNSGLYSTGRMLHALSEIGQAPSALGAINRRRLPAAAITLSAALMLVGVLLNFLVPDQVFIWVTSVALIGTLWTWGIIMLAHRGYKKAVHEGRAHGVSFRMPGAPLANWLVVGFLIVVAALLSVEPGTRVALYVAPIWFALLGRAYVRMKSRPRQHMDVSVGQSPLP